MTRIDTVYKLEDLTDTEERKRKGIEVLEEQWRKELVKKTL